MMNSVQIYNKNISLNGYYNEMMNSVQIYNKNISLNGYYNEGRGFDPNPYSTAEKGPGIGRNASCALELLRFETFWST